MPGPVPGAADCVPTHHVLNEIEDNLQSRKQVSPPKIKCLNTHILTILVESLLYARHRIGGCGRDSMEKKGRQV